MAEEVIAPCSSRYISEEELVSKLKDSSFVVLDCRERGPNIKGANRVRLPKVECISNFILNEIHATVCYAESSLFNR